MTEKQDIKLDYTISGGKVYLEARQVIQLMERLICKPGKSDLEAIDRFRNLVEKRERG